MAINMVMPLLIPLEEDLHNATRLLPEQSSPLEFSSARYCAAVPEDSPPPAQVLTVTVTHTHGAEVRYSITGGNSHGLFTIDQHSGLITLAAALDHELSYQHELEITAETEGAAAHTSLLVQVVDVNDNAPEFVSPALRITVIEEDDRDLPATIARIEVVDVDSSDASGLVFRVSGDGVDELGEDDAFFTINPRTGHLIQLRALDRDPPQGRDEWKLWVEVRDGQGQAEVQETTPVLSHPLSPSHLHRQASWGHREAEKDVTPTKAWSEYLQGDPVAMQGTGYSKERRVSGRTMDHSVLVRSERESCTQPMQEGNTETGRGIEGVSEGSVSLGVSEGLSHQRKLKQKTILFPTLQGNNMNEDTQWWTGHDGDGSTVTPMLARRPDSEGAGGVGGMQYEERRSFPAWYPGVRKGVRRSPVSHPSPHTTITAASSPHQPTKQNWRAWTTHHNLHLHVKDKSESTSQLPHDTGNKSVTPQHDPPAQATLNHHPGHNTHDFQISNGTDATYLRLGRLPDAAAHMETPPPDHPQVPRHAARRGKWQSQEGRGKIRRAMNTASLSTPSNTTSLNTTNGPHQHLVPLSPQAHLPPDPPGAAITHEALQGSLLTGGTERGFLQAGDSGRLSKATQKSPLSHGNKNQHTRVNSHSLGQGGDRTINTPLTLQNTNLESPAATHRMPLSVPWAGDEAGQDVLTPTLLQGRPCEGVLGVSRGGGGSGKEGSRVNVVKTVVTVVVKDINDNAPVFPNTTMTGHVLENGHAGEAVVVVSAWDADDASDGTNARLTYAIEKNVVDEGTGSAIFTMESRTGLVRTARCCLDRETTPEYQIQVVASDGGGLKGTGTVVIRVGDQNDNSPRLARRLWELEVDETPSAAPPPNTTLLELTAADRDEHNAFLYRVVSHSGHGWDKFAVRSVGASGQLFAVKSLDYELETHRRGFRFMVQVTDQGVEGWQDLSHVDSAWVTVRLRDVNDNPPLFSRPHVHVTVKENAAPGTSLATLYARDPDASSLQGVEYRLEGGWDALAVDGDGAVSLVGHLDREAPGGEEGVVVVVAVDKGSPPLSATATLTITVMDVNDCPPILLPPTLLHVTEGGPPTKLGVLRVTDRDVWSLGHGPPFSLSLAPTNPPFVLALINLKFDSRLDSGRGGAEVWTAGAVDREQHHHLSVGVMVGDAQGLTATHTVTVVVDDLNDNPMKPAAKTVYLWKTQGGGGSDAPLGRVFVRDPDDWDLADKYFEWAGSPHPLFTLRSHDGTLFASSQVREGRYDLQFSVSDRAWRQKDVIANVTVLVRLLTPDALAHAAPLSITPTTPAALTRGWSPSEGGGRLGALLDSMLAVVEEGKVTVEVVSVYGGCALPTTTSLLSPASSPAPSTCVWVSVKDGHGNYLDPVKIQGLLVLHTRQILEATNLTVTAQSPPDDTVTNPHLHSAPSLASTTAPLQVVDTNATSLVTPRLIHTSPCHAHTLEARAPSACLNGGRFISSMDGGERCVCPGTSSGGECKVVSRTFSGSGWAWLRPLPPCLPTTISLRLLTHRPHALLLYAGPLSPVLRRVMPTPMLTLQLVEGRPQALVEGGGGSLKLYVNTALSDGRWHTLHLILDHQDVVMMVDLCGRGWEGKAGQDTHCLARAKWHPLQGGGTWTNSAPLQVGGFAHSPPRREQHGWREAPTHHHLTGCLAHLTINNELIDLGEPAYSHGSAGGCLPQDTACAGRCGVRGQCVGGLVAPWCECDPGWTGSQCAMPTVPVRLGAASYMKVALSFSPAPRVVKLQVRVRLAGPRSGLLLHLAAHHRAAAITLHLKDGVACASMSGAGWATRRACLDRRPLGDGAWHTVAAERHGHNLLVSVGDGDGWSLNQTLASLDTPEVTGPPPPLMVDKHDGVTVGGLPEFVGVNLVTVHDDLQDVCLDDLRVSDHPLPLPPAVNGTAWGQVTTMEHIVEGCQPDGDPCANISCAPPRSCHAVWNQPSCSCGPGKRLVDTACQDVDECVWRPCLHGGSCLNLQPGYLCVCGSGHVGDHCQWSKLSSSGHPLAGSAAIAAITVSVLVLVVLGVVLSLRLHRLRMTQALPAGAVKGGIQSVKGGAAAAAAVEGSEEGSVGAVREDSSDTLIELLKLRVSRDSSSLSEDREFRSVCRPEVGRAWVGVHPTQHTFVVGFQPDDLVHNLAQEHHSTTPLAGVVDSTTPLAGLVDSTTPLAGLVDSTTPLAGLVDSTTPLAELVDSTTPFAGLVDPTTPI